MSYAVYFVLAVYILIGTIIAIYSRKYLKKSAASYFIAGRELSGIVSALTYAATTYSAFMMVGLVGFAYKTGVGALGFELVYLVGTLFLLTYFAPRIWRLARDRGYISPAEMMAKEYKSRELAVLIVLISLIALIPYTSIQLIGLGLVLEKVANVDFAVGVLLAAAVVVLWAFLGGLRGVAWTDAVQGFIMLSSAVLIVVWVLFFAYSFESVAHGFERSKDILKFPNEFWSATKFFAFITPWFFFALTNPQVFQRIFVPKDLGALRNMILLFGTFGLIYTFLVTLLGISLRSLTEIGLFENVKDRDMVTPTLLSVAPEHLMLLVVVSIFAASVTTANSIMLTLSSMVSRDILREASEERQIFAGRVTIAILTVLALMFAFKRPNFIVELAVLSSTMLLPLVPIVVFLIYGKTDKIAALTTLIAGFLTAVLLSITKIAPASIATFAVSWIAYLAVYSARKKF